MSLIRQIQNIRKAGFKQYWRDLQYIGTAKAGTLVGVDRYGNRFYENLDEQPGRHRWVDYSAHDFNTQQVEPIWHSWLQHIRQDPPNQDPIVAEKRRTWETGMVDSVTGTRGSFRTYNTTRPKVNPWEPKAAPRG